MHQIAPPGHWVRAGMWGLCGLLGLVGCDDGGGGSQTPAADMQIAGDAAPTDGARADAVAQDAATTDAEAPRPDMDPACSPGTEDCRCLMDGTCRLDGLLCVEGRCVDANADCDPAVERCPPANPKCYTPCRGDIFAEDGTLRVCSPEGLMAGCLAGAVCDRGACVPEGAAKDGEAPGTCESETACADFQTCIRGRCYSDCDNDANCADGATCFRHVCRQRCTDEVPCAAQGYVCNDGLCLPLAPPGESQPISSEQSFALSGSFISFTSGVTEGSFSVANLGNTPIQLVISKDEQRTFEDGREVVVTEDPLLWLEMGIDRPQRVGRLELSIGPGNTAQIQLAGARTEGRSRWEGRLKIESPGGGPRFVRLEYSEEAAGRWVGSAYAFGVFPDGARPQDGFFPLEAWRANRANTRLLDDVPNAFMQAWGRFRSGDVGLPEMAAIIDATLTGSWDFPRVRELCLAENGDPNAICAPFGGTGSRSVITYTATGDIDRVPSGMVELDFALNLRKPNAAERDRLCGGSEHCVVGRIDSSTAIQYAGNPEVALVFDADPTTCAARGAGGCTVSLRSLDARIAVGGRYQPEDGRPAGCGEGFLLREVPWLVPGFAPISGDVFKTDCVDQRFPGTPEALANPLPDGQIRQRTLELIDGMMVEQHVMTLILRESVLPFHGGAPFSTYHYVVLERSDIEVAAEDSRGNTVVPLGGLNVEFGPTCDPALVRLVTGRDSLAGLLPDQLDRLGRAVASGTTGGALPALPANEAVHSLCIWSEEVIIGAQDDAANPPAPVRRAVIDAGPDGTTPCLPGAEVIYFTTRPEANPASWDCNQERPEDCLDEIERRLGNRSVTRLMEKAHTFFDIPANIPTDLVYQCRNPANVTCSDDRYNLLADKNFGIADDRGTFFQPLPTQIAEAFRYKTSFVDRVNGAQVGFAPVICEPGGRMTPYCYDPAAIEAARARMDCVIHLHSGVVAGRYALQADVVTQLQSAMNAAFSALDARSEDEAVLSHGFERLYAELQIMLGDDAYTAAFASRFDLAGVGSLGFEGSLFELSDGGGIDLSGAAGYEMYKLHQATQYYDLVIERFHEMSIILWNSLSAEPGRRYVTATTITSYLDRVIRASTRSAAAWGEIAARYQALNRSDLARTILTRASTRAWQESLVLREFMNQITKIVSPADLPQVYAAIDDTQLRYRVAQLDMKARFQQINARIDAFGLPPDYIPFPALDEDDVNGFEVVLDRAISRLELAAEDEQVAIESRRDFDVDQASFQSELVTLRNSYEAQLGAICGTFRGEDGRIYPAIGRYADRDPTLATLDDPCGASGNGELWLAGGNLQGMQLELQRVRQEVANVLASIEDAKARVATQCSLRFEDVGTFLAAQGAVNGLERDIDAMSTTITVLDKVHDYVSELTARVADIADSETPWGTALKGVQIVGFSISAAVNVVATTALEAAINVNQQRIREIDLAYEAYTISRECDYLQADLVYEIREQHRELLLLQLDVLNAVWNVQVEIANIQAVANERTRLEAEWQDTEQLAINVAAAQTDPNIRIFKNDAIQNADRSFNRALREAWKATRIYEYYTASSYADREKLFLVRLVNAGDINLRRYLNDLEDAFFEFEQVFGNPDTRVITLSLRDDILRIPRYADTEETIILTAEERIEAFRAALQDPNRLDDNGALSVRFSTTFDALSPITANHKILFIETEIFGEHGGDEVGRIYLSQQGTGVLEGTDDTRRFFTFPPRTAVMNPFFNGNRAFGQDSDGAIAGPTRSIYRSYRFRERPVVQTDWSFVLDRRGEEVNRDIDFASIDDIVVYIYYTDFTVD